METFRLKSMVDFVLEKTKYFNEVVYDDLETASINLIDTIEKYANFLKQPLKLEMFIGEDAIFIFQWEFKQWDDSDMENQKIEDLLNDDLIYVLKDNAIKSIFD